jgi:transcriptional regulator with XRE-family HTH domain
MLEWVIAVAILGEGVGWEVRVADREDVEIGALVAKLRVERGLCQSQAAERVGVTSKRIARLESGKVSPTLPFLNRVVGALGWEVHIRIREGWEIPSEAIRGIGREYGLLLQRAGVDRVEELARENPAELRERLVIANRRVRTVRRLSGEAAVCDWVRQASESAVGTGENLE